MSGVGQRMPTIAIACRQSLARVHCPGLTPVDSNRMANDSVADDRQLRPQAIFSPLCHDGALIKNDDRCRA